MAKQNQQELELISKFDQLLIDSKNEIVKNTIKSEDDLNKLLDVYSKIKITNIDSKAESDHLETGLKDLKKIRLAIQNNRENLTAPALNYQKDLIAYVKPWIETITATEDHLKKEKQKYDDLVEAEKNRLFTERASLLAENGYQLQNGFYISGPIQVKADTISDLTDDQIQYYVKLGKDELDRKQKELEREERLNQREKELAEKMAVLDKKLAELTAKEDEMNKKSAELNAQEIAIEKTYDIVEEKKLVETISVVENPNNIATNNDIKKHFEQNQGKAIGMTMQSAGRGLGSVQQITESKTKIGQTSEIGDIFSEPTEYQKGFNACRNSVLELLKNPESYGKTAKGLADKIKSMNY